MKSVPFEKLKGKTIKKISNLEIGRGYDELIEFQCTDGSRFGMKYDPDCCASCNIEDIAGDITDLLNTPILLAEEVSSREPTNQIKKQREKDGQYGSGSETWTFYKLSTIKGSVTIRWYGESNGYYSESASFYDLNNKEDWQ
jgi:hypothetical protein